MTPTTNANGYGPIAANDCPANILYICDAATGYDGPSGIGAILGDVAQGAPGIGGPSTGSGTANTYTQATTSSTATLAAGVYPNGLDTSYYWQYGIEGSGYTDHTTTVDIGSGPGVQSLSSTLTGLVPNVTYDYQLVAWNADGTTSSYNFTLNTGATNSPPANTIPPSIAGIPDRGQTLTASPGSWSPTPSGYSYQWQSSPDGSTWSDIAGANADSYTPVSADEGNYLRVVVTAANGYGGATADSTAVGPVSSNPPVDSVAPSVTGTTQRTYTLSATTGTWSGANLTYSYQWQRSTDGPTWANIAGATSSTYTLAQADEGDLIRVAVQAADPDGVATADSAATQLISPFPPANTVAPTLSGTAQRTYTLSATPGTWTGPDNTYSYRWQRDNGYGFFDIPGATGASYTLGLADENAAVRVVVTATNPDGTIQQASNPTGLVAGAPPINTAVPTVSGITTRTFTLAGGIGTWSGIGNSYGYQWQSSPDGNVWTNIAGATGSTYILGVADENTELRLQVTATNVDGSATAYSSATSLVTSSPPSVLSAPTLTGSAVRGDVLSAGQGSWAGAANSYAATWQESSDGGTTWTAISGASGLSYTLTAGDEGDLIRYQVSATNADGTITAESTELGPVLGSPPVSGAAPTVSGTTVRGDTLIATIGGWTGVGSSYTTSWQRSADGGTSWSDIAGATAYAYTLSVADEGDQIRFQVVASNPDGTVTADSAATIAVIASPPVATQAPALTGTAIRGSAIIASPGSWTGNGNTYSYQWQSSPDGSTWTAIAGASGLSYTPTVADEGNELRFQLGFRTFERVASAAAVGG